MKDLIVTASELARNTSAVLDEVQHGRRIVIERHGKLIARLEPTPTSGAALLGRLADQTRQVASDHSLMAPIDEWDAQ